MSLKLCCALPVTLNCLKSLANPKYLKISQHSVKQISLCSALQQSRWLATDNKSRILLKAEEKQKNPLKRVYYGPLSAHVRAVKLFSLSSSVVGISVQPILYQEIVSTGNLPIILAAYSFIGFFTVVTPLLLHFITKKYITELLYNEETESYVAKSLNLFCTTKVTEFKVEDVYVPDVPGMFSSFHIKGKPFFVDLRNFERPEHYGKLMGFDKPMDFKLFENELSGKAENTPSPNATTSSGSPNK